MPAAAVIKALRAQARYRLRIGAVDMNEPAVGFCLSDWHERVPGADHPEFVEAMLRLTAERGVAYVFPIIDEELPVWARARARFAAAGVTVFANPPGCVALAQDKWRTAEHCAAHGIAHPTCYTPQAARALLPAAYPLFAKPSTGRGSVGAARIDDPEALHLHLRRHPNAIVQTFAPGIEFTTDVLVNDGGGVMAVVPKQRLEVKSGMATKSVTRREPVVSAFAEQVALSFGVRGVANVQTIVGDGGPCLIEVNPKFAASLPLTVAAGVNLPLHLLELARGDRPPDGRLPFRPDLLLLRCWEDHFTGIA